MTFFHKPLDHFHDSLCPTVTGMKVDWVIAKRNPQGLNPPLPPFAALTRFAGRPGKE
jgi:hypothetical protein